jgi:hypothetical protein
VWDEYGFQIGDEVNFLPGSRRSGGFGLTSARLLAGAAGPLQVRSLAQARVDRCCHVVTPAAVGILPGERLLVVRGSGRALGFLARGPIYQEAVGHSDLPCFSPEQCAFRL